MSIGCITGWENGLAPAWHQAITCTKTDLLIITPLETNLSEMNKNATIFIPWNTFENVVCKTTPFYSRVDVLVND